MSAPNEPAAGAEVLSQSEVENLLAQVSDEEGKVTTAPSGEAGSSPSPADAGPKPYDFRHPVFLSPTDMRRLRIRYEDFLRALGARLSIYLRLEFSLQMTKLEAVTYRKFTSELPNPSCLSLFKVEPLRGIGVLAIHPRLALTIVDRLLGGPAHSITADHTFSEIEMALIDQVVQLVLGEWCNHWTEIGELKPSLLGHESDGKFLATAAHDAVMLVLTMEAKMSDCVETIQLALPCFALEPLVQKLGHVKDEPLPSPQDSPTLPSWNSNFDEVPVTVTGVWEDIVLTARDVANLKAGDTLPLDSRCTRQVKLRLGDLSKFEGQLGTTGGKWAVALTGNSRPLLTS